MSQRLGDLLVKEKVITPEQLEHAIKTQKQNNCRLGSALVKLAYLTDEDVTNFLSRQYGVPAINLSYFEIDPGVNFEVKKINDGHAVLARQKVGDIFVGG